MSESIIVKELLPLVVSFLRFRWLGRFVRWIYRHRPRTKSAKFYDLHEDIRSVRLRTGTFFDSTPSPLSGHGDPEEDPDYEVDADVLIRKLRSLGIPVPPKATSPWWHECLRELEVLAKSRGYKGAKKLQQPPKGGGPRPSLPFDW